MGTELRSPVHTIIGFADLLGEESRGPLNAQQKRYVQHILQGSEHLLTLINDILDLGKMELGELCLHKEIFKARPAVLQVVSSLRLQLDRKSLQLEVSMPDTIAVHADFLRFKQVLYNLLSNAIKFTPPQGRIDISLTLRNRFVEVMVRDNGIGIPRVDHEAVFEKFYQAGAAATVPEGRGLGLSIARAVVEHHGGCVLLDSEPGRGSCFTVTFPSAQTCADSVG